MKKNYQEQEEEQEPIPTYAGGTVLPDEFKLDDPFAVDGGASTTAKSPPIPPQVATPPVMQQPMTPKSAPVAAPAALTATPRRPLPGMPPSVTPEDLKSYLDQKRSKIGKYGADEQYGIEKQNIDNRKGLGYGLASAASTFADGVMQGVARAGNPGFAKALEDQVTNLGADEAGAFERGRKNSMEEVDANSKVDAMDPTSIMSKSYQQAFGPIFQKMGYPADSVMKMPASQIANLATLSIQYTDAQSQQELKRAMLGVQGMTAKANIANQAEQRREAKSKNRVDAAKDLLSKSGNARVLGVPIPFTSDVSGKDKEEALGVIRGEMKGNNFDTEEEAAAAGLPDGSPVTIGGVDGTWRNE